MSWFGQGDATTTGAEADRSAAWAAALGRPRVPAHGGDRLAAMRGGASPWVATMTPAGLPIARHPADRRRHRHFLIRLWPQLDEGACRGPASCARPDPALVLSVDG